MLHRRSRVSLMSDHVVFLSSALGQLFPGSGKPWMVLLAQLSPISNCPPGLHTVLFFGVGFYVFFCFPVGWLRYWFSNNIFIRQIGWSIPKQLQSAWCILNVHVEPAMCLQFLNVKRSIRTTDDLHLYYLSSQSTVAGVLFLSTGGQALLLNVTQCRFVC